MNSPGIFYQNREVFDPNDEQHITIIDEDGRNYQVPTLGDPIEVSVMIMERGQPLRAHRVTFSDPQSYQLALLQGTPAFEGFFQH